MNAQRSVWSIPLHVPSRGASYAGGYLNVYSGLVHLWFCNDAMQRVSYKEASIPNMVLDELRRNFVDMGKAVGCTRDGLFLFARFDNWRRVDTLYYVVVDKDVSEWRSGSVSLSSLRLPQGNAYTDLALSDYGRWLWDGRFITCLMYRSDRRETATRVPGSAPCRQGPWVFRDEFTTDETHELLAVQIDTTNNSVVDVSPAASSGSVHGVEVSVYDMVYDDLLYSSSAVTENVFIVPSAFERFVGIRFATHIAAVYGRAYRTAFAEDDYCESTYSCYDTRRNSLVYAERDVVVDEGSDSRSGRLAEQISCFARVLRPLVVDSVIEHDARPAAYIAYLDPLEFIVGCGTSILARMSVEEVARHVPVVHLTAIGASDDVVWNESYDSWSIVGATNKTISVFIDSPSQRLYPQRNFTTWWLLTISLETGRVIQEVKLEPVDIYAAYFSVEVEGKIYAMPMVSILGGGQFRV
jgi:hypothetical protein